MSSSPPLRIGFDVNERSDLNGAVEIIPSVDSRPLTALIEAFESALSYEPAGGYGGIIPSFYRFGPIGAHYLGTSTLRPAAKVPVLGCECGEWGCWPLLATITATDESVTWSDFEQPHRKVRDYAEFGPFVFDRAQYDRALSRLTNALGKPDG